MVHHDCCNIDFDGMVLLRMPWFKKSMTEIGHMTTYVASFSICAWRIKAMWQAGIAFDWRPV